MLKLIAWTYGEVSQTQVSADDIRKPDLQPWMLLVEENKFEPGKRYIISAEGKCVCQNYRFVIIV